MPTVAFLLTRNLHLLDLAGPAQVFSAAAKHGLDYQLRYLADTETVPTAQGLTVQATTEIPALGPDDLIVVPGCAGQRLTQTARLGAALMTLLRQFPGT